MIDEKRKDYTHVGSKGLSFKPSKGDKSKAKGGRITADSEGI